MKTSLFTRVGWFYLPCSVGGSVLCLFAAGFCATVFAAVDRHSHSVRDTLYGIYPYFVATFLLLDWVARRISESPRQYSDLAHSIGTPPASPGAHHGSRG